MIFAVRLGLYAQTWKAVPILDSTGACGTILVFARCYNRPRVDDRRPLGGIISWIKNELPIRHTHFSDTDPITAINR
jgi:hypothetical protein